MFYLLFMTYDNLLYVFHHKLNFSILLWIFQVELKEGPLEQFTHEMEPFLRKQGMPVRLNKGS